MEQVGQIETPLGALFARWQDDSLTELRFVESIAQHPQLVCNAPLWKDLTHWITEYFAGNQPQWKHGLAPQGTAFQNEVWEFLLTIPYGNVVCYGDIAKTIANKHNMARMSAQAVGQAVGRNPIAILIPCHRVIGADGSLTGYAAGIERKRALLTLEGIRIKAA